MLRAIKRAHPDSEVWWIASHITAMADALRIHTEHLVAHVETDLQLKEAPHRTVPRLLKLPRFDMVFDARTRVLDVLVAKMALRPREFYACLPGFLPLHAPPNRGFQAPARRRRACDVDGDCRLRRAADGSGSLPSSNAAREAAERDLPADRSMSALRLEAVKPRRTGLCSASSQLRTRLPQAGMFRCS